MKTYFQNKLKRIHLVAFLMVLLFTSCDAVLEEEPFTQTGTDFFYQNETDALAAVTAVYAQLKDGVGYYRQQYISNIFAASDQGASSWKHGNFRKGTIVSTDQNLPNPWKEMYRGIKDANNVIARVAEIQGMDEELQKRVVGEAKFLRALNYFNLVRCFGEVPLRTKPVKPGEEGLPVSPIEDIYPVIISDFQDAAEHCWGFNEARNGYTNDIGRVTKAAAHAMLAKVYLQIASSKRTAAAGNLGNERYNAIPAPEGTSYYQLAKEQCDLVLGESGYELVSSLEDWKKIFDPGNGNNAEMLFDVQGSSIVEQGTAVSNLFSPRNAGLSGGGWGGTNKFQAGFINKNIDKTDIRFQNSIVREYQDATKSYVLNANSTGYVRTITETGAANGNLNLVYTSKYIDGNATTEYTSQQNWHIIRLADVYLMRAETLAELNEDPSLANADLNMLRNRVGMDDFEGTGMSMEEFRTALLRERVAELSMEGHRFFDLTRMGVYHEYCTSSYGAQNGARQPEDYTWPIPLIESSANANIE
jgi:hypothetical protein